MESQWQSVWKLKYRVILHIFQTPNPRISAFFASTGWAIAGSIPLEKISNSLIMEQTLLNLHG